MESNNSAFQNHENFFRGKRVLYLSPHLDDLSYSNGGLLLTQSFCRLTLVNVFTRSMWAPNLRCEKNPDIVTPIRLKEDKCFCRKVGISSISIGLNDSSLRGYDENTEISQLRINDSYKKNPDIIRLKIETLIHQNSIDIVLAPLALGNHVDHFMIFLALLGLHAENITKVYYEDIPYCALMEMDQIKETVVQRISKCFPYIVDITHKVEQKIENMKIYHSQINSKDIEAAVFHSARVAGNEKMACERVWIQF